MPKEPCVRTLMEGEYVKVYETLLKILTAVVLQYSLWYIWKNFDSKNSFLLVAEILRLFLYILPPIDKNSLSVKVSV